MACQTLRSLFGELSLSGNFSTVAGLLDGATVKKPVRLIANGFCEVPRDTMKEKGYNK
jgi:hypothetical protein